VNRKTENRKQETGNKLILIRSISVNPRLKLLAIHDSRLAVYCLLFTFLVFHNALTNSRGAFAKVFAKAAHAAPECRTGMKRPPVFHMPAKAAAPVTDAQTGFFVLVFYSAVPSPAKITAHAAAAAHT
jgi:hypothetical protein